MAYKCFKGSLIGLATPLCSCGALPVAASLAVQGVPLGVVVAFLTVSQLFVHFSVSLCLYLSTSSSACVCLSLSIPFSLYLCLSNSFLYLSFSIFLTHTHTHTLIIVLHCTCCYYEIISRPQDLMLTLFTVPSLSFHLSTSSFA